MVNLTKIADNQLSVEWKLPAIMHTTEMTQGRIAAAPEYVFCLAEH
jgi:hypothetical protein